MKTKKMDFLAFISVQADAAKLCDAEAKTRIDMQYQDEFECKRAQQSCDVGAKMKAER